MITQTDVTNYSRRALLALMLMVPAAGLLTAGCGNKEAAKAEKHAAAGEKENGQQKGHDGEHKETHGGGHEGEHEGEASDVVTLTPEKQKLSRIEVRQVMSENAALPLSATAALEMNMDRVARISARVAGQAVRIMATQGDRVKAGQVLAYLDSVELAQTRVDYLKAQGKAELARRNLQREEALFEKKISPEKDMLKARQEFGEAEADLKLAQERFRLFGVNVAQFEASQGNALHLPVTTPVGGVLIEKTVTRGEQVTAEKTLFTVADLSTLWVVLDIYEKDISRLRPGTAANVTVTAFPDKTFRGRIAAISDTVDEKTRTAKARVTLDNSGGLLKPGMFATVVIEAKGGGTERLIALPEEAVLVDGTKRYVFVHTAPDTFRKRAIEAGRTIGNRVEVVSGLREGEAVAVKGAFILKSELKKGELVDEHGHGK